MKLILVIACLSFGCDKLPDRPDEKTFKAAEYMEQCRLTAPRAIMCTDELMVADLRALGDESTNGLADVVEEDVANAPKANPKKERKESIAMHKTRCAGDPYETYPAAVYACWAQDSCKKFADCVMQKSAEASAKRRAERTGASDDKPAASEDDKAAAPGDDKAGASSDRAGSEAAPRGSADPAYGPGSGM